LLNNSTSFVNNYKTKHKIFILSIIRRSKTIITISKVIVLILLANIIVSMLLSKKYNRLSKIIENASISKKRERLSKIKTTTNNKKNNNVKILS